MDLCSSVFQSFGQPLTGSSLSPVLLSWYEEHRKLKPQAHLTLKYFSFLLAMSQRCSISAKQSVFFLCWLKIIWIDGHRTWQCKILEYLKSPAAIEKIKTNVCVMDAGDDGALPAFVRKSGTPQISYLDNLLWRFLELILVFVSCCSQRAH